MCTVSLIAWEESTGAGAPEPSARGLRLVCNRDESRLRPDARPPEIRRCGDFKTLMPIDPVSDGTWIAVNETGLAATLLNTYERAASESPARDKIGFRSRGDIVPAMMACADAREAAAVIEAFDPGSFPPFKAIAVDGTHLVKLNSDGRDIRRVDSIWEGRSELHTTSGMGDELVYPPRRALFDELFSASHVLSAVQDRFHRHQWPDRPHLSVLMTRPEARTVSTTIVEVGRGEVSLVYRPVPLSETSPELRLTLPRTKRI